MFVWQLSTPAQLNANVQPAVLPDDTTPPLSSDTCTVSGWGVTQIYSSYLSPVLRAVDVQIVSNCWRYYYWGMVTTNMLCAGSRLGGKDSCQVWLLPVVVIAVLLPTLRANMSAFRDLNQICSLE